MMRLLGLAATALLASNVYAADNAVSPQHGAHHTTAQEAKAHNEMSQQNVMKAHIHDHKGNQAEANAHAAAHNGSQAQAHLHDHADDTADAASHSHDHNS